LTHTVYSMYNINQVDYNQQQQESQLSPTDGVSAGAQRARNPERP